MKTETEGARMKTLMTEEDETGQGPPEMMMLGEEDRRRTDPLPGAGDQLRPAPQGGQQEARRLSSLQETGGWRESSALSLSRILLIPPTESKSSIELLKRNLIIFL